MRPGAHPCRARGGAGRATLHGIALLKADNSVQDLGPISPQLCTAVYGASITPDIIAGTELTQQKAGRVKMCDPLLLQSVAHAWADDAWIPRCDRASASVIEMPVSFEVRQAAMAE